MNFVEQYISGLQVFELGHWAHVAISFLLQQFFFGKILQQF